MSTNSTFDRISRLGFVLGIVAIIFLGGMVAAIGKMPPYQTVRDAWLAVGALSAQQELLSAKWPNYLWNPTERTEKGLVRYDKAKAVDGYTLYTSSHESLAILLDINGNEVYRWDARFRKVWPHANHVPGWVPDNFLHMRCGHVFPNGDLLVVYSTTANTPYGCGLAKLDCYGEKIWSYDSNGHHDFALSDDGHVFMLSHHLRQLNDGDRELAGTSDVPIIEDFVRILSPDGKELKSFSLLRALVESPYFRRPFCHADRFGDITHNNTIDLVGPGFAAQHEGVSDGDIMLCLRNMGLLVVVNPETQSIVWATTGPWSHPHDPDPLENGNILIFDNYFVQGTEHGSAVLEFDPRTREVVWQYTGHPGNPFRSDLRSRQQSLPGGNVLITESDGGRLLEVTRQGEVVWEYVNPIRGGLNDELIPVACGGERYTAEQLPFLKQLQREQTVASRLD